MTKIQKILILFLLLSLLPVVGCQSQWQISLIDPTGIVDTMEKKSVTTHINNSIEEVDLIALGQLFYSSGFTLINEITVTEKSGTSHTYDWDEIAESTTINEAGILEINDEKFEPISIMVTPSPMLDEITYSILDISPTTASALGLPEMVDAKGQNLLNGSSEFEQVVLILMDGVQFEKLAQMTDDGLLPFFKSVDSIHKGLTVYPTITPVATAALLTGTTPDQNGVFCYGYRSTESTTLFDLAVENGLSVTAIEGASLPFNLRNAETSLNGDKDGNGYSDDNVMITSLETIQTNLPDLLYIHFHEIDDMGHSFGENSEEYENALIRVDSYIKQIYQALPEHTLVIIFSDHGMHTTQDGGNHGTLTAFDLIIPIILITK